MSPSFDDWPYADLVLRTPDCPLCGKRAEMVVASHLHPRAWCTNDDCLALTWDPTKTKAELLADAETVDWPGGEATSGDGLECTEAPPSSSDGGGAWRSS